MHKKYVISIGGGSGTFPVIQALSVINVDIGSVICVSDSGGSSGRLRKEFGFQPVGDLRQALVALINANSSNPNLSRLLQYRFSKGIGLQGHNVGNLLLTALQDMTGDTDKALDAFREMFFISGIVTPATKEIVQLRIIYADGTSAIGEHILDEKTINPKKITGVQMEPVTASINPRAETLIKQADFIVIGPGDYYGSIMSVLSMSGMKIAFKQSSAKIIYVLNLMSRYTQTQDMTAKDYVHGIEEIIKKSIDYTIINNQPIPTAALVLYKKEHEFPVIDDLGNASSIIRKQILNENILKKEKNDTAHRSLIKHDSTKLAQVFRTLGMG